MKENFINKIKRTFGVGPLIMLSYLASEIMVYFLLKNFSIPLNLSIHIKIILSLPFITVFLTGYIWFWAVYLKNSVGTKVLQVGPYRLVRHPLYATDTLTLPVIFAIWMNNGIFFISWVIIIFVVYLIVKIEEKVMENKFGNEYIEYKLKVPSLFPYKGFVKI